MNKTTRPFLFRFIKSFIDMVQGYLTKRQFMLFSSILVGLTAGSAAILLKTFVHYIFKIATFYHSPDDSQYIFWGLPMLGIFLTVWAVKFFLKGKIEKGLPPVLYAIAKKSSILPREQMYAQIITSSLTVGFGGSSGLEAPIVITGAALGSNYAKTYHLNYQDKTLLLSCGVAAGIGAAFNAPIAGVLFALEVLLMDISITAFAPLIIAGATGALVSKVLLQDDILLSFKLQQNFDYHNVPFYVLLGVFGGLVSVYHSRVFVKIEHFFSHSKLGQYQKILLGGLILGSLIALFPSLFGEGYESIKVLSLQQPHHLLDESLLSDYKKNKWLVLLFVGILVFIKPIATAVTMGSGGNGGNFAPSLFVGAYSGFFFSRFVNLLGFVKLPETNFTIVGMAGVLSGIYHAPLTAIFLIAEITGGYTLMIPLMIVSSISFAISKYFEPYSMDTKRLALKGDVFTGNKDKNILTTIRTSKLLETNFYTVKTTYSLGDLVKVLSKSNRNIFPVINEKKELVGIILLDNIREIIFKHELYATTFVADIMVQPPMIIDLNDSMEIVMKKFDETGAWNLPVLDDGKYMGFISKSSVFSSYRSKLKTMTVE